MLIDAIAFKFQTGTQRVHLSGKCGNWRGVHNRLRTWAVDGTRERVFTALVARTGTDEDLNWTVSVGSTIVRAHQHAAGPAKRGPDKGYRGAGNTHSASVLGTTGAPLREPAGSAPIPREDPTPRRAGRVFTAQSSASGSWPQFMRE